MVWKMGVDVEVPWGGAEGFIPRARLTLSRPLVPGAVATMMMYTNGYAPERKSKKGDAGDVGD